MIDFTMPGHPAPVPQTWKQGWVQSSPSDGKAANSGRSLATPLGSESAPSETRADHSIRPKAEGPAALYDRLVSCPLRTSS